MHVKSHNTLKCHAASSNKDSFVLHVGAQRYPAKLVALPTIIESAKVGDAKHGIVYKSGEIARMLYVYEPGSSTAASSSSSSGGVAPAKDDVKDMLPMVPDTNPVNAGKTVCDSGITPPTQHIVRRRFKKAQRFVSKYTKEEISEAERVLLDLMTTDSQYEHVVEELVDAEPWMSPWFEHGGDHVTLVYEDGALTDMYQMQFPDCGPKERFLRSAKAERHAIPVRPNSDGTFGIGLGHAHAPGAAAASRLGKSRVGPPTTAGANGPSKADEAASGAPAFGADIDLLPGDGGSFDLNVSGDSLVATLIPGLDLDEEFHEGNGQFNEAPDEFDSLFSDFAMPGMSNGGGVGSSGMPSTAPAVGQLSLAGADFGLSGLPSSQGDAAHTNLALWGDDEDEPMQGNGERASSVDIGDGAHAASGSAAGAVLGLHSEDDNMPFTTPSPFFPEVSGLAPPPQGEFAPIDTGTGIPTPTPSPGASGPVLTAEQQARVNELNQQLDALNSQIQSNQAGKDAAKFPAVAARFEKKVAALQVEAAGVQAQLDAVLAAV